jgi:hypothetical protein
MNEMQMSKNCKISQGITVTAGAAGTSAINGATLDMAGWEGVLIIVTFGAIVTGAATSIKAQQGQASGMGDAADLLGSSQTIADTDDDKTFYIDIKSPRERYVRAVVSRATQNATVGSITYIQYGGRTAPVAAHGTSVSGEAFVGVAEGTA